MDIWWGILGILGIVCVLQHAAYKEVKKDKIKVEKMLNFQVLPNGELECKKCGAKVKI